MPSPRTMLRTRPSPTSCSTTVLLPRIALTLTAAPHDLQAVLPSKPDTYSSHAPDNADQTQLGHGGAYTWLVRGDNGVEQRTMPAASTAASFNSRVFWSRLAAVTVTVLQGAPLHRQSTLHAPGVAPFLVGEFFAHYRKALGAPPLSSHPRPLAPTTSVPPRSTTRLRSRNVDRPRQDSYHHVHTWLWLFCSG